jgi:hypothetical protein
VPSVGAVVRQEAGAGPAALSLLCSEVLRSCILFTTTSLPHLRASGEHRTHLSAVKSSLRTVWRNDSPWYPILARLLAPRRRANADACVAGHRAVPFACRSRCLRPRPLPTWSSILPCLLPCVPFRCVAATNPNTSAHTRSSCR